MGWSLELGTAGELLLSCFDALAAGAERQSSVVGFLSVPALLFNLEDCLLLPFSVVPEATFCCGPYNEYLAYYYPYYKMQDTTQYTFAQFTDVSRFPNFCMGTNLYTTTLCSIWFISFKGGAHAPSAPLSNSCPSTQVHL